MALVAGGRGRIELLGVRPLAAERKGSFMQAGGAYEFTAQENVVIEKVGGRARTWGVLSIVIGGILMLIGVAALVKLPGDPAKVLGGAVVLLALQPMVTGSFYMAAGNSLREVVQTNGNDVPLMMTAVGKITSAVRIEAIVTIVGFLIGLAIGLAFKAG